MFNLSEKAKVYGKNLEDDTETRVVSEVPELIAL